jgi:hypothetical protein
MIIILYFVEQVLSLITPNNSLFQECVHKDCLPTPTWRPGLLAEDTEVGDEVKSCSDRV